LVARSVGMFLTVHQQKAEPAAAYMAAVPFGFDASSPSCVRSVQGPIAPSACGVRRPNANPDHRDGAAPAAAARAARVRRRGKEARVQEAHTTHDDRAPISAAPNTPKTLDRIGHRLR